MVRPWMGEVDLTLTREEEEEKGKGDTDRCNLPSDFPLYCRQSDSLLACNSRARH